MSVLPSTDPVPVLRPARYAVTASAHALMWQRSLMTDGMWDAFLRANFPQP